ncbi:short-chain dehydrogenase/reductase family protein 42E member 1 [Tanacetum coccineum]
MHLSENEGIEGKTFVVTGGLGFVGSSLCLELIRRGARLVRAFDFRSNSPFSHLLLNNNNLQLLKGDIVNRKDVDKALRGVDCVFHLASFGMSGKEMLQYGRVDDVNINGTCHVLEACHQNGVKRLVYVSTSNVVFAGNEIVNGNEKLPYLPLDNHVDPYSRSKSIAEQLVLKSNGRPLKDKNGECLYTCAVRPAAIYGPGEERHLPRIINLAKLGLLPFKIGEPSVKSDWVYIDNLVLALIQASMGLLDDIPGRGKQPIAAGQPYFISDGSPVNTFEFLRPLLKSLEYDMPKATIPVSTALFVGKVWASIPLFHEITKSENKSRGTPQSGVTKECRACDGSGAFFPVPILRPACLFIIRSLLALRVLAVWAIAMHVGESIYREISHKKWDPANQEGGFADCSSLGFSS